MTSLSILMAKDRRHHRMIAFIDRADGLIPDFINEEWSDQSSTSIRSGGVCAELRTDDYQEQVMAGQPPRSLSLGHRSPRRGWEKGSRKMAKERETSSPVAKGRTDPAKSHSISTAREVAGSGLTKSHSAAYGCQFRRISQSEFPVVQAACSATRSITPISFRFRWRVQTDGVPILPRM